MAKQVIPPILLGVKPTMARILLFYHGSQAEEVGDAFFPAVKQYREALAKHSECSVQLRDARAFTGDLELERGTSSEDVLKAVYFLGNPALFQALEAFEAAEIEVAHAPHVGETSESLAEACEKLAAGLSDSSGEKEREGDPLADLKAEATALGINFAPNIGEATLRARVSQAKAEKEENERIAAEEAAKKAAAETKED